MVPKCFWEMAGCGSKTIGLFLFVSEKQLSNKACFSCFHLFFFNNLCNVTCYNDYSNHPNFLSVFFFEVLSAKQQYPPFLAAHLHFTAWMQNQITDTPGPLRVGLC